MEIEKKLLYTKNHEWVSIKDNNATIGITEFAQNELGDIIFIELPETNRNIIAEEIIGTIEAVKTVADIYSPLKGTISEINIKLEDNPEMINNDPYNTGWIIKLKNITIDENVLMTFKAYNELIS